VLVLFFFVVVVVVVVSLHSLGIFFELSFGTNTLRNGNNSGSAYGARCGVQWKDVAEASIVKLMLKCRFKQPKRTGDSEGVATEAPESVLGNAIVNASSAAAAANRAALPSVRFVAVFSRCLFAALLVA
jgi:hypothetical protein